MKDLLTKGSIPILLGTGGVGKTTIAAALALAGASAKLNTAVITVDPSERLRDALGLAHLGGEPTRIGARQLNAAGLDRHLQLSAMMLDVSGEWDAIIKRFVTDPDLEIPATRGWPQLRHNLVHDLAALNKTEMLLWEDWGVLDSHTAPGPDELQVLGELATLTGQPSPPLADLRSAYRRPEFVVPDTVTSYSPARTDVPAVVDVSAVARAAS